MSSFDSYLEQSLEDLRNENLHRVLRRIDSAQGKRIEIGGRSLLNFSSNDYLGLSNHPAVKQAASEAIEQYGAGSGASRLVCGSLRPHDDLEEALAEFKQAEAALVFSSGYATALGAICALVGRGDVIILDKLVHASIVDAARLSGAKLRVFAHNHLDELEGILKWFSEQFPAGSKTKALIVTESIFSMDGDVAPLGLIVALKEKYGAWLMVDEAHATGVRGPRGEGVAAEMGIANRVEVQMGTLGKALAAAGGYICGSRKLIDLLINRARPFIFSTAPVPAAMAAAAAALRIVRSEGGESRRRTVWERAAELGKTLNDPSAGNGQRTSAILPWMIGDERTALQHAKKLFDRGIFVPAIRHPSVPRGQARLRFTVTAEHTPEDLAPLAAAISALNESKPPMLVCT